MSRASRTRLLAATLVAATFAARRGEAQSCNGTSDCSLSSSSGAIEECCCPSPSLPGDHGSCTITKVCDYPIIYPGCCCADYYSGCTSCDDWTDLNVACPPPGPGGSCGGGCGDGICQPGETAASCPADCCRQIAEPNVVRGLDDTTGYQAHFTRGGWDLVSFQCDTRASGKAPLSADWASPPCQIRIDGGYLAQIPNTPTQYCWSDGVEGVVYSQTENGYQTSPPDDTTLVIVDGVPQIQSHTGGWAVTFRDEDTGAANTYTDQAGNVGWRRGQTRFTREDGEWNSVWRDNVTWSSDTSIPGWQPLLFAGHETTGGNGSGGFIPANVSATSIALHIDGAAPGTLTLAQVPSQYGGPSNGIAVSIAYDGSSSVARSFFDVLASDGQAYSWSQNGGIGETLTDSDGFSPYAGKWNTVVMAANATPPDASNGWADPPVAVVGKYPLDVDGLTWRRNGVVDLQLGTDAKGNTNAVTEGGGTAWSGTIDDRQRLTHETVVEAGTQTASEEVVWNPQNGLLASATVVSPASTVAYVASYAGASETPMSVELDVNGQLAEKSVPVVGAASSGFPYLKSETDTLAADAFGGAQPQTATFGFTYPSAGQVQIDESAHNIHVTVSDYADGRLNKVVASSPWVSSLTETLAYGSGYTKELDTQSQVTGGPSLQTTSTMTEGASAITISDNLMLADGASISANSSATWDGQMGFKASASSTELGVAQSVTGTTTGPLAWSEHESLALGNDSGDASGASCTLDASSKLVCMQDESEDGDAVSGADTEQP